MITVTVDCNNDTVTLDCEDGKPVIFKRQQVVRGFSTEDVQSMLEELLNMLDRPGTTLVRIDEDTRRTLGEW